MKTWNIILLIAAIVSFAIAVYYYYWPCDYRATCHWLMFVIILNGWRPIDSQQLF